MGAIGLYTFHDRPKAGNALMPFPLPLRYGSILNKLGWAG